MNNIKCGICEYKEKYILGELWLSSPNCGNHCKSWIARFNFLNKPYDRINIPTEK